jgi:multiple sugar transport system substrate-binding protein
MRTYRTTCGAVAAATGFGLLAELQDGIARPRPQTPACPAISTAFAPALSRISQGEDVRQALDTAVGQIDANLDANRYYPPTSP